MVRKPQKLEILFDRIGKLPPTQRPNLALLTEPEFLFSYKESLSWSRFMPDHGPVTGLRPERGEVMNFFARLELIINHIFLVHLAGLGGEAQRLQDVLDQIDLFTKIRLLEDWDLISKANRQKLHRLRTARNGFAHRWDIREVRYYGKPILQIFEQVKADASDVFDALITLYNGGEVDIDKLLRDTVRISSSAAINGRQLHQGLEIDFTI